MVTEPVVDDALLVVAEVVPEPVEVDMIVLAPLDIAEDPVDLHIAIRAKASREQDIGTNEPVVDADVTPEVAEPLPELEPSSTFELTQLESELLEMVS